MSNPKERIPVLVAGNLDGLGRLCSLLESQDQPSQSLAQSYLARFKLWAGSLGAHRASGARSLEYRLRDASSIRKHLISLLQELKDMVVDEALPCLHSDQDAGGVSLIETDSVDDELAALFDAGSEDEFASSPKGRSSELDDLLSGIGNVIDCLLRFSVTISNPAPHDHFKSRAGIELTHHFEHYDTLHVRSKYPRMQPKLSERLGRMLTYRRRYFKYREDHHTRLKQGLEGALDDGASKGLATTVASSLPQELKDSTQTHLAVMNDDRSDISATSYATSTLGQSELRVPPIPKQYVDGPFLCPFCYVFISVDSRHDWKKHVFRDVRPYACLIETCAVDHDFQRRKDWTRHMLQDHWRTWTCPFRCVGVYSSSSGLRDHLHRSHTIEVVGQDVDAILNLSSTVDVSRAEGPCPFCGFEIKSSHQYQSHLGHHLEQLALFVLPTQEAEDDDDDDDDDDDGDDEFGDDKSGPSQDSDFDTGDAKKLRRSLMPTREEPGVYMEDADEHGNPIDDKKTYVSIPGHSATETKETRQLFQLYQDQQDEQTFEIRMEQLRAQEEIKKEIELLKVSGEETGMKTGGVVRDEKIDSPTESSFHDSSIPRQINSESSGPKQIDRKYKSALQYQEDGDGPTHILTAENLRKVNETPSRSEESIYRRPKLTRNSITNDNIGSIITGNAQLDLQNKAKIAVHTDNSNRNSQSRSEKAFTTNIEENMARFKQPQGRSQTGSQTRSHSRGFPFYAPPPPPPQTDDYGSPYNPSPMPHAPYSPYPYQFDDAHDENDEKDDDNDDDDNDATVSGSQQQAAPRQRTLIACRSCRERKIRCSGYSQTPNGKCTNCRKTGNECIFQPASSSSATDFAPVSAVPGGVIPGTPFFGAFGQPLPQGGAQPAQPEVAGLRIHNPMPRPRGRSPAVVGENSIAKTRVRSMSTGSPPIDVLEKEEVRPRRPRIEDDSRGRIGSLRHHDTSRVEISSRVDNFDAQGQSLKRQASSPPAEETDLLNASDHSDLLRRREGNLNPPSTPDHATQKDLP